MLVSSFIISLSVKAQQNIDSLKLQGSWKLTEIVEERYQLISNVLIQTSKLTSKEDFRKASAATCTGLTFQGSKCRLQTNSVDGYFDYTIEDNRIQVFRTSKMDAEIQSNNYVYQLDGADKLLIGPITESFMENGQPVKRVMTLYYKKY